MIFKANENVKAFAGIGGGGMTTVVSILMSDIVPLRERGTWQGIINIIYATGAGCGAPLGLNRLYPKSFGDADLLQVAYWPTLSGGDGKNKPFHWNT